MELIKQSFDPVDQQGNWLRHLNNDILDKAVQAKMYLKDPHDGSQDKTLVIYALLGKQGDN